jgi:putative tricarboxylic transport membrane protein
MEILQHLATGFLHVFEPLNLLFLFIGLVLGPPGCGAAGADPRDGRSARAAVHLPDADHARIILLTAMYVSGTYAGAWTSILFRVPGEPMDVPLLWDGYTMARKGRSSGGAGLDAGGGVVRWPGIRHGHGGAGATDRRHRTHVLDARKIRHRLLRAGERRARSAAAR